METTPSPSHAETYSVGTDGQMTRPLSPTSNLNARWRAMLAGALAGLIASAVMLWAGDAWGGVILPQLIADRATAIVPLDLFRRGLESLEANAKPALLVGLALAQMAGGALIALAYRGVARRGMVGRVAGAVGLSGIVWLLLSLVAAPLGDIGFFGLDASGEVWRTQAVFIVSALVFGAIVAMLAPWPALSGAREDTGRRSLLRAGGVAALTIPALLATGYIGRSARDLRRKGQVAAPAETTGERVDGFGFAGMPPEITPTDDFYVVSKNFADPSVNQMNWTLEISGLVERPTSLSVTDVTTRESVEFASTLCCISNPVGGRYISTAIWSGFPLRGLLDEAGLREGVVDIELHAEDGYVESIPLAEALAPDTMLVHSINGELLPDLHGAPLRLIVPNIYGMKNVKWITKIIAVDRDIQGYWQERGWSDIAIVETMSRIDAPKKESGHPVGVPIQIGGVAFAGARGVSKVEVSLDDGKTWREAELSDPPSELTWRLWKYEYIPDAPGVVNVVARATDGAGAPQIAEKREPLPDGATGYDRHTFEVG